MRPPRLAALTIALVAVGLAACGTSQPGWTYAPAPSVTPAPSVSAEPTDAGQPSDAPSGTVVEISALNIAFDKSAITVPAGEPFQIVFANNDAGIPHNVAIHEGSPTGPAVFTGEIFNGVETRTYDVPALAAGTYGFVCTVHPNMLGTLTAE
ncbi:MAG: cupredoxin domain-containing protein [Chloroflexota bacterium]